MFIIYLQLVKNCLHEVLSTVDGNNMIIIKQHERNVITYIDKIKCILCIVI